MHARIARSAIAALILAIGSSFPLEAGAVTDRTALRVFVSGLSESGKSRALHQLFTARTPRVLSLDPNGEVADRNPDAIRTYGLEDLKDALRRVAGARRWHVAAYVSDDELPRLFAMLAPNVTSDDYVSYSRAVGGLAVECGEASWLAPNGRTPTPIKTAFFRGRHHLLSLYMATQRPAEVDRCVTSETKVLMAFRHDEQRCLDYWSKRLSPAIAGVIAELPRYHSIFYTPASGVVRVLDADYRSYRVMDPRGREISPPRPSLVRRA